MKAAAAVAVSALILVSSGCGVSESATSSHVESGERWASSMQDFAKIILKENGSVMGDVQKAAVERVAKTGKVSIADYETGLSGYRQCLLDKGYKEIIFVDMGNGMKAETSHKEGTEEQEERYSADSISCFSTHSGSISALYEYQVGNPSLIKDHYQAVAECLKQRGLVESSYTGKQYKKESEAAATVESNESDNWPFSYDKSDQTEANICKYANGETETDESWPIEQLW
ncbi:hypothetical protein EHS19_03220 [Bifidobacterium jacchi]|uniref:Uncharacterized protein n=2 Tax=Bifidobacterium jacchi TaxID=2490545 RepID=A0A5N5RLX1_9BIFI|nr:hypothetical protein EHS19_03220 [Bifidobacterium jacchi]